MAFLSRRKTLQAIFQPVYKLLVICTALDPTEIGLALVAKVLDGHLDFSCGSRTSSEMYDEVGG